jgi:hypothetical protein
MQDQFVIVLGEDQIDAGPLEFSVEKQLRVRDDDRIRGSVGGVNGFDVDVAIGMQGRTVSGKLGVKFARVIQMGHRNG